VDVAVEPPPVAVTVMLEVTGAGVGLEDEPPQPEMTPRVANTTATNMSNWNRLRRRKPRKQRATAKVAGKMGRKSRCTSAAVAGGVMVSVVVADAPAGRPVVLLGANAKVEDGLKLQLYPVGTPLHAKVTDVAAKLLAEVTVIWVIPTVPGSMVSEGSDILSEMPGVWPAGLTAKVTVTGTAAAKY